MENIFEFICNYYIWFILIAIILFLALIGYLVENKRINDFDEQEPIKKVKKIKVKRDKVKEELEEQIGEIDTELLKTMSINQAVLDKHIQDDNNNNEVLKDEPVVIENIK